MRVDVVHRPAVAHDVAPEAPLVPQPLLQQVRAGAAGRPVHRVVDAHDRLGLALDDGRAKRRQVGAHQVLLAHPGVEGVPLRLGSAVHRVVLRRGDHLQIVGIIPLHPRDERHGHAAGQVGVFPVRLLASPPAGIPEDVDVRGPVGQPGRAAGKGHERLGAGRGRTRQGVVVLGPRLGGDDVGHPVHEVDVPGGGEPDGLREDGGTALDDAVKRLVPPVVGGHPEAWNRRSGALHLEHLLLQRHARDEVRRATSRRQVRIEVGSVTDLLSRGRGTGQRRQGNHEESGLHLEPPVRATPGRDGHRFVGFFEHPVLRRDGPEQAPEPRMFSPSPRQGQGVPHGRHSSRPSLRSCGPSGVSSAQ